MTRWNWSAPGGVLSGALCKVTASAASQFA